MDIDIVFGIVVLILSVVIHEMAHAYAARGLGDPTPEMEGRLTLNPFAHLDLFGSLIVPTISFLAGGFIIGWAKPVGINPYNFKRMRKAGEAFVAFAGPLSNILIAVVAALIFRAFPTELSLLPVATIVMVNIGLAVFNLIPIPPLDGSKILYFLLGIHQTKIRFILDQYGLLIALLILLFLSDTIGEIIMWVVRALLGI